MIFAIPEPDVKVNYDSYLTKEKEQGWLSLR